MADPIVAVALVAIAYLLYRLVITLELAVRAFVAQLPPERQQAVRKMLLQDEPKMSPWRWWFRRKP